MAIVEVHLDSLDIAEREIARLSRLLDDGERARAARFRFDRDRRRFVARRAILRAILGRRTGERPERLTFTTNAFGKPALAQSGPCFSLSHSGDCVMVALADIEIGCDIEQIDDDIEWRPIADRLFAPGERDSLTTQSETHGRRGFFDCWARKEAFVKALGQGLSYPLDAFEVSVYEDARLLSGGTGWSIAATTFCPGYAGAIVAWDDGSKLDVRQAS